MGDNVVSEKKKYIVLAILAFIVIVLYVCSLYMLYYYATEPYRVKDPWSNYGELIMSGLMLIFVALLLLFCAIVICIILMCARW